MLKNQNMIFISAGHHSKKTAGSDPGAINKHGLKEGDVTIEFRDLISAELSSLGVPHKLDSDQETLQQYCNKIQTGTGSVVYECHLDAGPETATGTTSLIEVDGDRLDKACAKEIADTTALMLGIKNRGVKTEADTRHTRLALMKEDGIVVLHEICFITNDNDVARYQSKKKELAKAVAEILIKYENMIP